MGEVHDLRARQPDSEKITVNLQAYDLGRIDLLVREGFYANRADLIRSAIRREIERHESAVSRVVARDEMHLGLRRITRAELESLAARGEALSLTALGLVALDPDIDPDLARAAIARLSVLGSLQAPDAVKAALADRLG